MEPTIHDIGRPMIRSSRPTPPMKEEGEDRAKVENKERGREQVEEDTGEGIPQGE